MPETAINGFGSREGFVMRNLGTIALVLAAVAITGCNRSSDALNVSTRAAPQPLPSQPSGNVQTTQLEPLTQQAATPTPAPAPTSQEVEAPTVGDAPEAPVVEEKQVASLEQPKEPAKPITHEAMAGSWNVTSDNSDCKLILSFTQWSGGYRAATLRCNSPELSSVSAWDVKNNRVLLKDSNGNEIARVGSIGATSYSGVTAGGNSISFGR